VKEADRIGQCVLDQHALRITGNELGVGGLPLVGQQDSRLLVTQIENEQLAQLGAGEHHRLPTDEEWAYAAGSRYKDDSLPVDDSDPSKRWLARYDRESNREFGIDSEPQPFGHFGVNENGLYDTAGNVWEWTSTYFVRSKLDENGQAISKNSNCGVRVAEGQHRSYVTDFIRDARAGGCAAGVPPDNLGFRLVRERKSWVSQLSSGLSKALSIARS